MHAYLLTHTEWGGAETKRRRAVAWVCYIHLEEQRFLSLGPLGPLYVSTTFILIQIPERIEKVDTAGAAQC